MTAILEDSVRGDIAADHPAGSMAFSILGSILNYTMYPSWIYSAMSKGLNKGKKLFSSIHLFFLQFVSVL